MSAKLQSVLLSALLAWSISAVAAETPPWPHWRGPHDCGSAAAGPLPVHWSDTENVLWKVPLPGKGCSTPVVAAGKIFLTAPVDGQDAVLAYDLDGKSRWQCSLGAERKGKHRNGSGCNPSPVTDGQRLFAYFKSGTLAAFDLEGKLLWKTNVQQRYGKDTYYWDLGTSPVLTQRDVVVAMLHHGESYLVAFDQVRGDVHWKVPRNYETPEEDDHSYATPLVLTRGGRETLLVWGAEHLTAHDAADGRQRWSCGDFNPEAKRNWVAVASPVVCGDLAIVPYGRGKCLHGIALDGTGDVTATHRKWKRDDTGAFVPTPAAYQGRVYLLRDEGQVECLDPLTGKTLWDGQLPKKAAKYYASPLVADGKLYAAREDGMLYVVKIDGRFELLAENNQGQRVIASPVPLGDRLLVRGEKDLFCLQAAK